ncbi:GNAT family N-acetyltransferase [Seonamhaeicola sp. S2-3]|uniref:GNAT family N-acetyltransferase n=1 Tax=Seonamhaeicola sp. S2-3 TaxID=1936081 RepID=UPI0009726CEB|nr:GNAT family N-acetyltransferase [Seonamhaeicola sp. S2-3]APY10100.1 GNAT family N-acetyltransferase [Seonamhaeicola sp. S2-3]
MQEFRIVQYSKEYFHEWNNFILNAKNSTFLFNRNFMEYHQDRFQDFSLLIFKENKLNAVLPANKVGSTVISHQGLSYGGLVFNSALKFNVVIKIFTQILYYLKTEGIDKFQLKILPSIYSKLPNDELLYLMFLVQAKLIKREALSVLNLKQRIKISNNRLEGYKRGIKYGLEIKEDDSLEAFWNTILVPNLKEKHKASPVHSLEEINQLKIKFPDNIKQYNVYYNEKIVAGTTLFITENTVRTQYISGNSENNKLGSIDFMFVNIIEKFKNKYFLDLGASNTNNGKQINTGLQYWKEGLGARTVAQDFYEIETKNHKLLKQVMI